MLTKRNNSIGFHATTRAAPSSTTFFQNVCQLVSTSASPKQPQSLTGLATASQSVSGVITASSTTAILDASRRRMAKSRKMPMENSSVDSAMLATMVPVSLTSPSKCIACR